MERANPSVCRTVYLRVVEREPAPGFGHLDLAEAAAAHRAPERFHLVFFAVNKKRPPAPLGDRIEQTVQFVSIGVCAESVEHDDSGLEFVGPAEDADLLLPLDDAPAEGVRGLDADAAFQRPVDVLRCGMTGPCQTRPPRLVT